MCEITSQLQCVMASVETSRAERLQFLNWEELMEAAGLKAYGTSLGVSPPVTEAPWNGFHGSLGEAKGARRTGIRGDETVTLAVFSVICVI